MNALKKFSSTKAALLAMFASLSLVATSANAALTLDSTSILADIATAVTFVTTVGLAVMGLIFVIKVIKWARAGG